VTNLQPAFETLDKGRVFHRHRRCVFAADQSTGARMKNTKQIDLFATSARQGEIVKRKKIVITETDFERLQWLIDSWQQSSQRDAERLDDLENELRRAMVVKSGKVPPDVVTMNSRVRIKDLNRGRELTYQIVFPEHADLDENRISVLAPIGTALLGYRAGTTVEWQVPSGTRRFRILDVEYQPEAVRAAA
jgi:regulator of nucleoside diphosphate kinase